MLRSWQVLILHCFLLWLLVASSLSSPFLKTYQPDFFNGIFVPVYYVIVTLTLIGWSPKLGGCALTQLEIKLRMSEGKAGYDRTFIVHYLDSWAGISVRKSAVTAALVTIMLLPACVFFFG